MRGRQKDIRRRIPAVLLLLLLTAGPAHAGSPEPEYAAGEVAMTLAEYLEKSRETWFLTGKKEHAVRAMTVSKAISFHNDMEVTDYTVTDDGVTVVMKGAYGEMWASKLPKVIAAYIRPDGSEISAEDFAKKDEYIDLAVRPTPDSYYAMHVPPEISVTVETARGDVLYTNQPNTAHGDGDYLVCRRNENGWPDLSDVWVLNGVLFCEYYMTNDGARTAGEPDA